MMNAEALAHICVLMDAMYILLWKATDLMEDVLNTLGESGKNRLGWKDDGARKVRHATARGSTVALKDLFWNELETKKKDAHKLSKWFSVDTTEMPERDEIVCLSSTLAGMEFVLCKGRVPARYENLKNDADHVMDLMKKQCYRVLYRNKIDEECRTTVKLIVDVFKRVYDLMNRTVVPLIRDELLEVAGGLPNGEFYEKRYKLKERDDKGDIQLAVRMEDFMLEHIREITSLASVNLEYIRETTSLASTTSNTNNAR